MGSEMCIRDRWYGPNNATMVIAGDINKREVKSLVEKYFGEIKPGPDNGDPEPQLVKLSKTKKVYHEDNFARSPRLTMNFASVDQRHFDAPALELLGQLLGDGKKSPLYKVIVEEKKLAPSVYAYSGTQEVAGTFDVVLTGFPSTNLTAAENAIFEAFERLETDGLTIEDYGMNKDYFQNTFATSFEQVAHRVTCLQDPKLPGIPFHMLRVDIAGNISKRFSLSGIEIPRYGGACPRWNIYSAFTTPGKIHAAVSKMSNGEKYVCIARTVEKGVGRYGKSKSMLSIGLGCEAKYAKDFVYTENLNVNDKKIEMPIGVSCRTCDRLNCSQRAFPPLHKKFDVDINSRGVSVYVTE